MKSEAKKSQAKQVGMIKAASVRGVSAERRDPEACYPIHIELGDGNGFGHYGAQGWPEPQLSPDETGYDLLAMTEIEIECDNPTATADCEACVFVTVFKDVDFTGNESSPPNWVKQNLTVVMGDPPRLDCGDTETKFATWHVQGLSAGRWRVFVSFGAPGLVFDPVTEEWVQGCNALSVQEYGFIIDP